MTGIVLINKNGEVKSHNIKQVVRTELYKKCGFKIDKAFELRATWDVTISNKKYCIELWAKNEGNANTENKYDFPPPVDSELYFGTCCLIRVDKENNNIISLSKEEWYSIYEKLFGGFEDIEVEDEYSEDELAEVPKDMKTKTGYLKDDFVVDDCNDDDDDDDDDDDSVNCWVNKEEEEEEEDDEENDLQTETYNYSDEDN